MRVLSLARERWAATLAAITGTFLLLAVMGAVAVLVTSLDFVVHGPTFLLVWLVAAAAVGGAFAGWARRRFGRYRLGADIEADAFAMADIDLLRRAGNDYEVGLCPGMTGVFEHRHSSLPIEAYVRTAPVYLPLPPAGRVRIEVGTSTFVISRKAALCDGAFSLREWLAWLATGHLRRLLRGAALAAPFAMGVTMLGAVPGAHAVGDREPGFSLRSDQDPLAKARRLWRKAQYQTASLHQCFETMPLSCQRSGFVAVGLELTPEGRVASHWVARTSYGDDCPVTSCMENVVANWTFEPMNDSLRVVLPIEVTRTPRASEPEPGEVLGLVSSLPGSAPVPRGGLAGWGTPQALFVDMSDGGTMPGAGVRDAQPALQ